MIILKYPTYEDKVDTIAASMAGLNQANILNVAANDTRKWVRNTDGGAIAQMGYCPRGDNVMTYWANSITDKSFNSQIPWNCITPWFVAGYGVGNQAVNTGVNVSGITLQFFDYSIQAWREVDTGAGNPTWGHNQDYSNSTITNHGDVTKRVESNGSWSITISPTWGVVHGGHDRFYIPDTIADHLNLRGIFVKMRVELVKIDPSGVDDRSLAQILFSVSADFYPETTTTVSQFAGTSGPNSGYAPATSLSRWELVPTTPRDFYCATINPPTINPTISAYVVGGGVTLMPLATFESNLPPYIP